MKTQIIIVDLTPEQLEMIQDDVWMQAVDTTQSERPVKPWYEYQVPVWTCFASSGFTMGGLLLGMLLGWVTTKIKKYICRRTRK
jgi:hypothetical protein